MRLNCNIFMRHSDNTCSTETSMNFDMLHVLAFNSISLGPFLWDIGKQHSPRCDAAEHSVLSGAILFA